MAKLSKFQQYYRKNKARIAAKRRKRYRTDKKYRERNLAACRRWRKLNKPWLKREKVQRTYLLIGEFAEAVGCSVETLRNLERKHLLPRATDGMARRRYNERNVTMVRRLVEFRRDTHYSEPRYSDKLKRIVKQIKVHWQKA